MAREKASQPSRMIRVPADLAEMLGWIVEFSEGETVSDIVDPLIRKAVERRFERIKSRVEIVKAARSGQKIPSHTGA